MSTHPTTALGTFWDQFGRHGAAYLVAESVAKGGIYILFVWLATLMSVTDFGLLNVFVALLTLVAIAIGLGLPEGLLRFHFSAVDFRAALSTAMALPVVASLLVLLALIPWGDAAADALNVPTGLLIVAIAGAPLVSVRQSWLAVLRARRESRGYIAARMVEPVIFLLLLALIGAGAAEVGYRTAALAYLGAVAGAATLGVAGAAWRFGFRLKAEPFIPMIVFSLPLVGHGLAMTGLSLFDQLVIQQIHGARETGTYAFAYRFGMAMSLIVFAFTAAWSPLVIQRLQADRGASLRPLAEMAFRLLLLSSVLLSWSIPVLADILGRDEYSGSLHLIPLVVYAYLWLGLYGLAVGYLYFRRRSGLMVMASGTAFLCNAVLNYLAVPAWGAEAAAVTTVISYVLLWLLVWRALGHDRLELPWGKFAGQTVAVAPLIAAAVLIWR